jgi:hypothetical protein
MEENPPKTEGNHKYTGCLNDRYVKIKIHISKCVNSTDFQFAPLQRKLSNCFLLPTIKDLNVGTPGVMTNIQMTFYLC